MGMSMPSCPGQQAMQQQIDTLTPQNADLASADGDRMARSKA